VRFDVSSLLVFEPYSEWESRKCDFVIKLAVVHRFVKSIRTLNKPKAIVLANDAISSFNIAAENGCALTFCIKPFPLVIVVGLSV